MFKNKKTLVVAGASILIGVLFFTRLYVQKGEVKSVDTNDSNKEKVVVYKSPTCGCCVGYIAYLKEKGYEVEEVNTEDTASVKNRHNIPHNMQSCHTTEIGEYFIEGHMPIEAINKLLAEKPDIDGITLPDMPAGSPGMPGVKREEFVIYSLKDGESSEFMRI